MVSIRAVRVPLVRRHGDVLRLPPELFELLDDDGAGVEELQDRRMLLAVCLDASKIPFELVVAEHARAGALVGADDVQAALVALGDRVVARSEESRLWNWC